MQPALFIGGLMVLATAIMFATKYFHTCDVDMSESLKENKRIRELTDAAMERYPQQTMIQAMQHYLWDLEERIETLKKNSVNTDVVYAIKADLNDCMLLRTEVVRLINQEIEFNSHYNLVTSAQL